MYTIRTDDGGRDLKLEYNLSKLEHEFAELRKNKLNKRLPLSSREFLLLCMFTAAMFGRTKAYEEHWRPQWKKMLDFGERLQEQMDNASPEERTRIAPATSAPHIKPENILTLEDVRRLAEHPIQSSLADIVTGLSPLFFKTPFRILETTGTFGFITSDAPCVWFDPAQYQVPKPFGAGGLVSPTIEITMPLSPT